MDLSLFNTRSKLTQVAAEPFGFAEDNSILLDWLSGEIKQLLSRALQEKFNTPRDYDIGTDPLHGLCSFSQAIGAYALLDKGLEPRPFSTQSLENHHVGHAMMTVELPRPDGSSELFLIDPTFRQFCDPNVPSHHGVPMPGYFLLQSEKGRSIVQELLENGYIRIDAETAEEYLSSFCSGQSSFNSAEEALEFIRNPPYDGCYQNFSRKIMGDKGYLISVKEFPVL